MKSPATLHKLGMAGLLHDIGLKQIDRKILEKPRVSLTSEEERLYEGHPQKGAEILSTLRSVPGEVLQIVLQHQERDSGSGYPFSLTKNKIFPLARIVAVVDPSRSPEPDEDAVFELARSGFDPCPGKAVQPGRARDPGHLNPEDLRRPWAGDP